MMIAEVRPEAMVIALLIVTSILVATHPRGLKRLSSGSFSAWSAFKGRPDEFFERVSDVIRGFLIGGFVGGSVFAIAFDWSMPASAVLGALLGIIRFSALRVGIAVVVFHARSPEDQS